MVAASSPTLAKIRNKGSLAQARALLYIAICEVCDFFNVGKNMSDTQVALTVDLILESYWHLHLEEIKYCFRRAMMREKLFDRLDGNIIIGWIQQYDDERTEEAMRQSERLEAQAANETKEPGEGAVTYDEFVVGLKERAAVDAEAAKLLESIENPPVPKMTLYTKSDLREKELDFKRWFITEYLPQRNPNKQHS